MKFTFEAYENLIKSIKDSGYNIAGYRSYGRVAKPCILRHDVDMSLEIAARFADFEADLKEGPIHSTYFVLISSDLYNAYAKKNIQYMRTIMNAGHEIGLHFDEKRYMDESNFNADYLKKCVQRESVILSEIIETPVYAVSMHRPSKKFLEANLTFDGLLNSYSKLFFDQFKYISDSRMNWREDVRQIVCSKKEEALHILTHPIWYSEMERNMNDILQSFIKAAIENRYESISDNLKNLDEILTLEDVL